MYDLTSATNNISNCRRWLFTKKTKTVENIPPTRNTFIQNIRRACYRACMYIESFLLFIKVSWLYISFLCIHFAYFFRWGQILICFTLHINFILMFLIYRIWNNSLLKEQPVYDPQNWGWVLKEGRYQPLWMTQREASNECRELIKCGCKKRCTGRCRCKKADLPCSEHCKCGGGCL